MKRPPTTTDWEAVKNGWHGHPTLLVYIDKHTDTKTEFAGTLDLDPMNYPGSFVIAGLANPDTKRIVQDGDVYVASYDQRRIGTFDRLIIDPFHDS